MFGGDDLDHQQRFARFFKLLTGKEAPKLQPEAEDDAQDPVPDPETPPNPILTACNLLISC